MKSFKTHRFENNPVEKQLHDDFINNHIDGINSIVFPPKDFETVTESSDQLNEREISIVLSTIQWLGSAVGQHFLHNNGFNLTK